MSSGSLRVFCLETVNSPVVTLVSFGESLGSPGVSLDRYFVSWDSPGALNGRHWMSLCSVRVFFVWRQ